MFDLSFCVKNAILQGRPIWPKFTILIDLSDGLQFYIFFLFRQFHLKFLKEICCMCFYQNGHFRKVAAAI